MTPWCSEGILTDAQGRPIPRPLRSDFSSDLEFIRAVHKWRDRVSAVANEGFNLGFSRSLWDPPEEV